MGSRHLFAVFFLLIIGQQAVESEEHKIGLGFNVGTFTTHKLPADVIVKLLKDNGADCVKLFDAEPDMLDALAGSGIKTMVGIPNDELKRLAGNAKEAEEYVAKNVSHYREKKVDINYVGVGNEPFLTDYKGMYNKLLLPAVKNIHAALNKAGLAKDVKTTIPFNADILHYGASPPEGDFRPDIKDLMVEIVKFLNDNKLPISVNFYPFFAFHQIAGYEIESAMFHENAPKDGKWHNAMDYNYDTLASALEKNNYSDLQAIVGEIGWPSDGVVGANVTNAQRFNQGLIKYIRAGKGSVKRPNNPPLDIYLFSLFDENNKTLDPGNFERHWGVLYADGSLKYPLDLGGGKNFTGAKGVKYLEKQWCVVKSDADGSKLSDSMKYACDRADCSPISNVSSCSGLDDKGKASYAFNSFFQTMDQKKDACDFNGLATVSKTDPSTNTCKFEIMIDTSGYKKSSSPSSAPSPSGSGSSSNSSSPHGSKSSAPKVATLSLAPMLGGLFIFALSYLN